MNKYVALTVQEFHAVTALWQALHTKTLLRQHSG